MHKEGSPNPYLLELKERGMRMVQNLGRQDPGDHGIINRVSRQLEVARVTPPVVK